MSAAKIGFTRKKVQSLTLGEKLQKVRGRRRMSLIEAAKHTKIQARYLTHLEAGDYEKLPADVYVRGFLRSYASFLGIEEASLMRLYDRERGIHDTITHENDDALDQKKGKSFLQPKSFIITPRMIIATIGGLFFLVVGIFLYKELDGFVSSPWLVIDAPSDGTRLDVKTVSVEGKTDSQARVFINDEAVLVDENGVFIEEVGINRGANTITVRSQNTFDKESVQTRIVYGPEDAVVEQENDLQEAFENVTAVVRTGDVRVWLSVRVDGDEVYSKTAEPNTIETYEADEVVSITAGVGNQVFVRVNDREESVLSDEGGLVNDIEFRTDNVQSDEQEHLNEGEEDSAALINDSQEINGNQENAVSSEKNNEDVMILEESQEQ